MIDRDVGVAIVSSDSLRETDPGKRRRGALYRVDLRAATRDTLNLTVKMAQLDAAFHPHGMDLFKDEKGARWLYVISHRSKEEEAVEIFEWDADSLRHARTLRLDPSVVLNANDLVVVSATRFYLTNSSAKEYGGGRLLERLFSRKSSYVVLCEEELGNATLLCRQVGGEYAFVNGIAMQGNYLLMSASLEKRVYSFRVAASGEIEQVDSVEIKGFPDNLSFDERGDCWVAIQKAGKFGILLYAKGLTDELAGSTRKLRLTATGELETVVSDKEPCSNLSGWSVVAPYGDMILIGTMFEGFEVLPTANEPSS